MRVAIFTGPTGGHFYPALAFSAALKKRYPEVQILFVTGDRGRFLAEKAKRQMKVAFEFLPDFPFPRTTGAEFIVRFFSFLLKLALAFSKTERILNAFRPDLSIGFGSYVSFPGLVASRKRKILTLVHEQNQTMGQANAWLSRFADRIALSFEATGPFPFFDKTVVTGLPLRASLVEKAVPKVHTDSTVPQSGRMQILLLGGSQGSHSLNHLWIQTLPLLTDEEKSKIAVIHITGVRDFGTIQESYRASEVVATVFPYYEQMEEFYPKADLAVTRAGAGTLFELALFGLPAVVLPYPHAEGHQEVNALYFEKEGGIFLVPEKGCTHERLKEAVFKLVHSAVLRKSLSENLIRLAKPDASERLVDIVEELMMQKEVCLT